MNKNVLIVGMNPHTIDFSLPGYIPGMTAEKVEAGIRTERENLKELGFDTDMYLIDNGDMNLAPLADKLREGSFDGIMVGAGVRLPPSNFLLFEKVVNTVHEAAPGARIMFNSSPVDTADAIRRWL